MRQVIMAGTLQCYRLGTEPKPVQGKVGPPADHQSTDPYEIPQRGRGRERPEKQEPAVDESDSTSEDRRLASYSINMYSNAHLCDMAQPVFYWH